MAKQFIFPDPDICDDYLQTVRQAQVQFTAAVIGAHYFELLRANEKSTLVQAYQFLVDIENRVLNIGFGDES